MKTQKIQNLLVVTLFCTAALAGLTACDADPVEREGGKLPDKDGLENTYGMLRSNRASENEAYLLLTQGAGFVTDNIYYQITKPAAEGLALEIWVDNSLLEGFNQANETEYELLPEANCEFPDGKTLTVAKEGLRTDPKRIKVSAEGLEPGEYLLPVSVADKNAADVDERQVLYYTITIRQPQLGDYELHDGSDLFFVFYINTSQYQPLLVDDYFMQKKLARGSTVKWYSTVGNIINLRTVRLDYEAETGRAKLSLGSDMRYVLDHYVKYNSPLQDKGRKLCMSIEGGGKGLGFCNLSDMQIADFASQIKAVVYEYGLDGVNLWDRNSSYGKEGMPAMNTTSYPKLIKALREALGSEKMITVTVYDKPTESFWDTEASGGIAVGDYIDYAWSGYNNNNEAVQLLDPWHTELEYVSAYTQKPIANLPKERYGCVNFPIYPGTTDPVEIAYREPDFLVDWVQNKYKPNQIVVFDDIRTILQDKYETAWDPTFAACCTYMDDESRWILGTRNGYSYTLDTNNLGTLPNGTGGYGKWLKDW